MIKWFWRVRFMFAVSWILRDFWSWNRFYMGLGWDLSRTMDRTFKPYETALNEITRWYTE